MKGSVFKMPFLLVLLVSCGGQAGTQEVLKVQDDKKGLLPVPPQGSLEVIRSVVDERLNSVEGQKAVSYIEDMLAGIDYSGHVGIWPCPANAGHWHGISPKSDVTLYRGAELLTMFRITKAMLAKSGVPSTVWSDGIKELEEVLSDIYEHPDRSVPVKLRSNNGAMGDSADVYTPNEQKRIIAAYSSLVPPLNNYLTRHGKTLRFDDGQRCGGGPPISAKINLVPSDGTFSYIDDFNFRLCQVKTPRIDPWDPKKCTTWRQGSSTSGQVEQYDSGTYHFYAEWDGGKLKYQGKRTLDYDTKSIEIRPEQH